MDPNAISGQIAQLDSGYNPTQVYNDALSKLGVSDARTRVQGLRTAMLNNENLINNVDSSVTGRTQNSLVTEAQRQRLVGSEKAPLLQGQATLSGNYNTANADLGDLTKQAQTQASLAGESYKTKRQSLADQLGFAQHQQAAAESKRQFDVSQANQVAASKRTAGARAGGGGWDTKDWAALAADIRNVPRAVTHGAPAIGKDNFANPAAYKQIRDNFIQQGGSGAAFDSHFGSLRNPDQKYHTNWEQY